MGCHALNLVLYSMANVVNVLHRGVNVRGGTLLRKATQATSVCSSGQQRQYNGCNVLEFGQSSPNVYYNRRVYEQHRFLQPRTAAVRTVQNRFFWKTFNRIVNKPDYGRMQEVGMQRACAEWLVRCGAHIRWEGSERWERDYNALPPDVNDNFTKLKIAEVNAVDASVMYDGFVYFEGIDTLKKMRFHACTYFGDDEATGLYRLKDSLHHLEISSCPALTDKGIIALSRLKALKTLKLRNLSGIKKMEATLDEFQRALPTCEIVWEGTEKKAQNG